MEAAVLGPAVMTDVDCGSLNAELEVKKLQQLVRKLERQNKQLRSRAGGCLSGGFQHFQGPLLQQSLSSLSPPEEPLDHFHQYAGEDEEEEEEDASEPSVLDELELLNLESLSCSEESDETWLYVASKAGESSAESLSPLQWCRQNLDSPKSDVEVTRRSLSLRLEQVSRWRSSLSSPGPPPTRAAAASPPPAKPCSTPPPPTERHASPLLSSPLHPVLHRTLSPLGRELSPVAERTPTFLPHPPKRSRSLRRSTLSPESSVDSDLGMSEDDSISLGYKLQDLTDVQVMARLQEESLRQDYASTSSSALAGRRSQSFTFQLSQLSAGPGLEEEDEEDEEDYALLPPPQPRLTRLSHSHTFCSVHDWRRSTSSLCTPPSTPSMPPRPSAGSAYLASPPALLGLGDPYGIESPGFNPGSDKLRRSMPNLVRAPSMPSVPIPTSSSAAAASSSLLHNSQSFDSSSGLARLQSSSKTPAPPILCRSVTNRSVFRFLLRLSPLSRPASEPGPEPRELLLAVTATTESHRLRQPDGQGPDVRQPHVSERQRHPSAQQTSRRRLRPRRSATPRLHPGPHKLHPPQQGGFIITKFTDASKELVHLQCPSRQRLERRLLLTAEHPAGWGPRRGRAVGSEASDLRFCVGTVGFCLQSYAGFLRRTRVTFLDLCATYAGEFGGLVPKASRSPLCNKPPAAG